MQKSTPRKKQEKEIVKPSKQPLKIGGACRKYHGTHFDKKEQVKKPQKPLLVCDWLQFWAKIKYPKLIHQKLGSKLGNFTDQTDIQKIGYSLHNREINGDPMFIEHATLKQLVDGVEMPIAHISYQPKLNTPIDYIIIKIDNWALYKHRNELKQFIHKLEFLLAIEFQKLSRLDIAVDFQHFANKLHPQKLIQNFHQNKYIKRYSCTYSCTGKAHRTKQDHYIRFGTKNQPVQWYLYNKSKELREKTDKPHIRNLWDFPLKQDVWRLEFSIKPHMLVGQNFNDKGEIISTKSYGIQTLTLEGLTELFDDLFFTHCDFRINDGKSRKDRMKRVPLFKELQHNHIIKIKPTETSNRMDKIFIGMLERLNRSWRNETNTPTTVDELRDDFLSRKQLNYWFIEKFINNEQSNDTTKTNTNEVESQPDFKGFASQVLF